MKNTLTKIAIFAAGSILTVALLTFTGLNQMLYNFGHPVAETASTFDDVESKNVSLVCEAIRIAQLLESRDYQQLADAVHPEKGVYFVPYSTVDMGTDLRFSSEEVRGFQNNTNTYVWGTLDGVGSPISMTPAQYFDRFVYDASFVEAQMIGINTIMRAGNSLENVIEAFPEAAFVELHLPGTEENSGMDWRSLKFVFEDYNGQYKVVAIIHSEWTI